MIRADPLPPVKAPINVVAVGLIKDFVVIPQFGDLLAHEAAGYAANCNKSNSPDSSPTANGETGSCAADESADALACVMGHLRLRGERIILR